MKEKNPLNVSPGQCDPKVGQLPDFTDKQICRKFWERYSEAVTPEFESMEAAKAEAASQHDDNIVTKSPGWTPEEIRESFREAEVRFAGPIIEEMERWRKKSMATCHHKVVGGDGCFEVRP